MNPAMSKSFALHLFSWSLVLRCIVFSRPSPSAESEAGASTGRTERDPETQALRRGGRDEVNSKSLMSNNGPGREGNRREEEKGSELVELRQRLANEERLRQEQAQQFQERLEEVSSV